jgi:hypothetical protein
MLPDKIGAWLFRQTAFVQAQFLNPSLVDGGQRGRTGCALFMSDRTLRKKRGDLSVCIRLE